ncbi:MAG: N-acetylglucosamine-6-phosphate deacetylase [Methanocellales archaeon]|nr:N-acetylglucosamine-6-phosphate deacetylase [Methanocellales archaeon]MDD3292101.1 N-acetylglucosamine-6-phosphate deacetylase [Methanocellales archaeon]MDD5235338.1 N-acetylglucosamine-6-phosphate deacetylase [Methanocellales archaeon]MDD5485714.1 N-acetylglucosamine-6-phosphate deacetylase [Methanocellales archaeon]
MEVDYKMKYALVNCDIYTGKNIIYDKAIIIEGNKIKEIVELSKIPKELEAIDLNGLSIAPGFIDVQVNGGGGCLFNENPTEECISSIYEAHKRFGTTSFLPTIFTVSTEKMLQAIEVIKRCIENRKYGVIGLHIEGPYINENKAGVHDKRFIQQISDEELDVFIKDEGVIKLWTLAPELVEEAHIEKLRKKNIIVSAGHTDATYEQTKKSFKWGISSATHLFNAMSQFVGREPGVLGAVFDTDKIWAGIIADGMHVHFASVRVAKKIKQEKLILVTDAMPPVGKPTTTFKIGTLEVSYSNGKCVTKDGTLAGSALDMATAVRNCIQKVGISKDEALRMASTYPAEFLGIQDRLGKIKIGYTADMVIFNNQIIVKGVIKEGKFEKYANFE